MGEVERAEPKPEKKPSPKRRTMVELRPPRRWGWRVFGWGVLLMVLALGGVAAYLSFWPSPIEAVAYVPPRAPALEGSYAANEWLEEAELLGVAMFPGPEDVDVDAEGRVYGGCVDGLVRRWLPDGKVEIFADTKGRPLGLDFDAAGNLVVADGLKGLLRITPAGEVETLATEVDGAPFGFADDVDVAEDGTIYFSDASDKFGPGKHMLDLLEGRPHGQLLKYDPKTQQVTRLLGGLHFANGVAVAPGDEYVLVNETWRYRIQRYWLKGPKAGQAEVFVENLPGFPDGVSSNGQGTFWVALFTVRNPLADRLAELPWAREAMAKLPAKLWPKPEKYGFVLGLNAEGKVTDNLQASSGERIWEVTSVEEHDGALYLGSLENDRVGRLDLKMVQKAREAAAKQTGLVQ